MIIQKKTVLLPAGSRTRLKIKLDDPSSLTWGIYQLTLKNGVSSGNVSWGDGTYDIVTSENANELTHTYAQTGTYIVTISDDFKGLSVSSWIWVKAFSETYPSRLIEVLEGADNLRPDRGCFAYSMNLENVVASEHFPILCDDGLFQNCVSLATINLPGTVSLHRKSFIGCTNLREIHLSGKYESRIRGSYDWSSSDGKFGAPNAETSFDLP